MSINQDSRIRNSAGFKLCTAYCKQWQPESEFYKSPRTRDGLTSNCRTCDKDRTLRTRYNITLAEYNALLAKQGGVCAICKRSPGDMRLAVDHDHNCCPDKKKSCGMCVRGLLCSDCNGAIGMLQESVEVFTSALRYLGGDAQ